MLLMDMPSNYSFPSLTRTIHNPAIIPFHLLSNNSDKYFHIFSLFFLFFSLLAFNLFLYDGLIKKGRMHQLETCIDDNDG